MLSEKEWKLISAHPLLRRIPKALILEVLDKAGDGVLTFCDGELLDTEARIGFVLSGRAHAQTTDSSRHLSRYWASRRVWRLCSM